MCDKPPALRVPNVYVTRHSKNGDSIVLPSEPLHWSIRDKGALSLANIYVTNETPVDFSNRKDIASSEKLISSKKLGLVHPDGAACRYFDVALGNTEHFHQTFSVDFAIRVQGTIGLKLDSGDTRIMEPGDMVIQRATLYSWNNPSKTEWCRLVAVMMPAKEFKVDGDAVKEQLGFYGEH